MILYPVANKTNLVKLLRDRGYDVPSIRSAEFTRHSRSYWMRWEDSGGQVHNAYYTGAAGRPALQVDKDWLQLTMAEAIRYGLVEQK